jgi:hypothetical protein
MNEEPVEHEEQVERVGEDELVDGLPVLAEVRPLENLPSAPSLPALQAAAAAFTGFLAGVATLAAMRRRQARRLARLSPPGRPLDLLPAGETRTFLVRVQRVGRTGD